MAADVKSIIEQSTMQESAVLTEANSWRKKLHLNTMKYCKNRLDQISKKISNKVLSTTTTGTPDAAVPITTVEQIILPPPPGQQKQP
jgi:hypothetical protein